MWTCFDTVSTSKFEKLDEFKKIYKKKDEMVINNKKYLVNYLECHAPKIIGNRKLERIYIRSIKLSTSQIWKKIRNKNYKKNVYNVVNDVLHILIFWWFWYNADSKISKIHDF